MDLQELKIQTQIILTDVLEKSALSSSDIFVLGLSSSEVIGGHIGKNSSQKACFSPLPPFHRARRQDKAICVS